MHKYGESKTTRIMMATVTHVTSGWGLRKFQADGFLFDRMYSDCLSSTYATNKNKKKLKLHYKYYIKREKNKIERKNIQSKYKSPNNE